MSSQSILILQDFKDMQSKDFMNVIRTFGDLSLYHNKQVINIQQNRSINNDILRCILLSGILILLFIHFITLLDLLSVIGRYESSFRLYNTLVHHGLPPNSNKEALIALMLPRDVEKKAHYHEFQLVNYKEIWEYDIPRYIPTIPFNFGVFCTYEEKIIVKNYVNQSNLGKNNKDMDGNNNKKKREVSKTPEPYKEHTYCHMCKQKYKEYFVHVESMFHRNMIQQNKEVFNRITDTFDRMKTFWKLKEIKQRQLKEKELKEIETQMKEQERIEKELKEKELREKLLNEKEKEKEFIEREKILREKMLIERENELIEREKELMKREHILMEKEREKEKELMEKEKLIKEREQEREKELKEKERKLKEREKIQEIKLEHEPREKELKEKERFKKKEELAEIQTQCSTKTMKISIPVPNNIRILLELEKTTNNNITNSTQAIQSYPISKTNQSLQNNSTSIHNNNPAIQPPYNTYLTYNPTYRHIPTIPSYITYPNNPPYTQIPSIHNNTPTPFSFQIRPTHSKKPIIPSSSIQDTYQTQLNTNTSGETHYIKTMKNDEPKGLKRKYDQIREGNYLSLGENRHYLRMSAQPKIINKVSQSYQSKR